MVSKRQQEAAFRRAQQAQEDADAIVPDIPDAIPDLQDPLAPEKPEEEQATDKEVVDAIRAGECTKSVEIMGHQVVFKALNVREELIATRLAKPMRETDGHDIALQTAYFAMSVISIDGMPFYNPIAATGEEPGARYSLALNYYRTFVSKFFVEFTEFRKETDEELDRLGK